MQKFHYQLSLILVEIGKNPSECSSKLISNIQSLIAAVKASTSFTGAMHFIRIRKTWLTVIEEAAPFVYTSKCSKKIKFVFWLGVTPLTRVLMVILFLFPIVFFLLPSFIYYCKNMLISGAYSYLDKRKKSKNRRQENLVVYCEPHATRDEYDDVSIFELKNSGIEIDSRKGILFMLSGYKSNSLYPFKKFLTQEGLEEQDFVIFTNHPSLSVTFQNTNNRYPIYSIHGSSVVDKNKEIEIYTEIYENFIEIEEKLSLFRYKDIPIASFMLTNFFTGAAIAAASVEAFKYCQSINRDNVIFITRGADIFLDSVLQSICDDKNNNLNEFNYWRMLPIYNSFQDVQIEYVQPSRRARYKSFNFKNVDTHSKNIITEKKIRLVTSRIERSINYGGLFRKTRAIFNELYNPYHYVLAAINVCSSKSKDEPIFIVTEADPKSIYWKAVYPVIKSIISKGNKIVVFTGNYSTYAKMRMENIEAFLLSGNISIPQSLESNQETNKLFMELSSYIQFELASEKNNGFKYFNQKDLYVMFNGIREQGGLYGGFRHSMMLIDILTRAFDVYKPRSVLAMPHASPGPAHVIDIAKKYGVMSVSMPSVTVDSNRRSIPINWKTDIIASYGEQCDRAFLDTGHSKESLVLTGNASLDALVRREIDVSEEEVRLRLGIVKDMKIVIVATSRIDAHEDIWLNKMHDHCEKRGDALLVIKSHPSFDASSYDNVRKGKHCIIVNDIPLYSLIYASTLLVTDYSTTGAEAALVGKPVVVVNLLGKEYPSNNYDQYGVALLIDKLSSVSKTLNLILDGDPKTTSNMETAQKKFVDDYNFKNDGHAADRIADILLNPKQYTKQH